MMGSSFKVNKFGIVIYVLRFFDIVRFLFSRVRVGGICYSVIFFFR